MNGSSWWGRSSYFLISASEAIEHPLSTSTISSQRQRLSRAGDQVADKLRDRAPSPSA